MAQFNYILFMVIIYILLIISCCCIYYYICIYRGYLEKKKEQLRLEKQRELVLKI